MDLLEIHNRFENVINKTTGQYFTHEEIDELLDIAQMQEFDLLVENSRELPQPRIGYARTQKIHEDLQPFLESTTLSSPATNNIYATPSNAYMITSFLSGTKPVRIVDESEIGHILDSEIVAPSDNYPVAMFTGENTSGQKLVRFYPTTVSTPVCWYLQRPAEPSFVYTLSSRVVTYDSGGSTQMLWKDGAIMRIIHRALALAGVKLDDQAMFQFNEEKQRTGQ